MKLKSTEKKMSDIFKEMALTVLKDPNAIPSSEAAHTALLLSHAAWNRAIGAGFTDAACKGWRKSVPVCRYEEQDTSCEQ